MLESTPSIVALKTRIVKSLGSGMIDVELTEDQLDISIQDALDTYREGADMATEEGWQFLPVVDNERFYPMPSYIEDITDISRLGAGVISGIEGMQYGTFLYQAMNSQQPFDLLSFHLTTSFIEMLNMMTAADPAYVFHSSLESLDGTTETDKVPDTTSGTNMDNLSRLGGAVLELVQTPKQTDEIFLLNIRYSRTDAELVNDKEAGIFIRKYAIAQAKIILGMAYRKVEGAASAGGTLGLPGDSLIGEGKEEQEKLMTELQEDYMYGYGIHGFSMG